MNLEDTGLVNRNIVSAKRTSSLLYFLFDAHETYLDYGGGYGLFVRLMRDYGFDFYWTDPFTKNIFAEGFEYDFKGQKKLELITAFECFEHFSNPIDEIEKLLLLAPSLLFSTDIFLSGTPHPDQWEYYYFSHGQHVAFYSLSSLQFIANKYNLHLFTNGKSFHLLTPKKTQNLFYQLLLKGAFAGLPSVIKCQLGTKMKSDAEQAVRRGIRSRSESQ